MSSSSTIPNWPWSLLPFANSFPSAVILKIDYPSWEIYILCFLVLEGIHCRGLLWSFGRERWEDNCEETVEEHREGDCREETIES